MAIAIRVGRRELTRTPSPTAFRQPGPTGETMALLAPMPPIDLSQTELAAFGQHWLSRGGSLSRTPPYSSSELGAVFDNAVGKALSTMLGDIPIVKPNPNSLIPTQPDCVEVGPVRIVGGVRPQNFDVGYRPDGVRFAFDSKTLNDLSSVRKNWQNMINDLATEATTVHTRFPSAVVAFMVVIPVTAIPSGRTLPAITETLERLARRVSVIDPDHTAEAMALILWNPDDGSISNMVPEPQSPLRIESFSQRIWERYAERFKGLPPHAVD